MTHEEKRAIKLMKNTESVVPDHELADSEDDPLSMKARFIKKRSVAQQEDKYIPSGFNLESAAEI